ncbi:MAG: branched-chain amino acid ABC transporter permease, partial [Candidatus Nitrotoga sp.]
MLTDFSIITQLTISGALMGLVYTLIAYGFQLTYATSKSINFGQGELVMLSAFFSLSLIDRGLPFAVVVLGGLLFGTALGLVVERTAVRLALEQKNEGWILLTVIFGLLGFSVAENIYGRDDRPFPTPISADAISIFNISITPLEISIALGVLTIMG